MTSLNERAYGLWRQWAQDIHRRTGLSMSKCFDGIEQTPEGKILFQMAKSQHDGSGQDSLRGAGDSWTADQARRIHDRNKGLHAFNQHVDALMAKDRTLSRSAAQDQARAAHPDLWQQARGT